ncbi:hypothetical protein J7E73_09300 [Paenibacillus albidus]|nr:hypothetical protein [Paenibacillus albidus]
MKLSAELNRDKLHLKISHWKLLVETNRYYEIKSEIGPAKRIYKEKLNTVAEETKCYTAGLLSCSAFCHEERLHVMEQELIHMLQLKVNTYRNELQLNQQAIDRHRLSAAQNPGEPQE